MRTTLAWLLVSVIGIAALVSGCGHLGGNAAPAADALGDWPGEFNLIETDSGCGAGHEPECSRLWTLRTVDKGVGEARNLLLSHLAGEGWALAEFGPLTATCKAGECVSLRVIETDRLFEVMYSAG